MSCNKVVYFWIPTFCCIFLAGIIYFHLQKLIYVSLLYPSCFDRLQSKMGHCPRNTQSSDQFYSISRVNSEHSKLSFYAKEVILTSNAKVLRCFGSNGWCFRGFSLYICPFLLAMFCLIVPLLLHLTIII